MALGYLRLPAHFLFLHLLFILPVYLPLTSCHSPLVFCPFKKYIELFTPLHAWYCYCQSTSLWKLIREKFLGHVCETCQRILINADKVFHFYIWTWSRMESFSSRCCLDFSAQTWTSLGKARLEMRSIFVSLAALQSNLSELTPGGVLHRWW